MVVVEELVFVGDRGMALQDANLRYITALTDPQIRALLSKKVLQLNLFSEQICEVQGDAVEPTAPILHSWATARSSPSILSAASWRF
jgi:hypothetical protein